MSIPAVIAAELAASLRLMPCTCNFAGSWPTFKVEACASEKAKHKLHTCRRCKALESYDAYVAIVQQPGVPAPEPKP